MVWQWVMQDHLEDAGIGPVWQSNNIMNLKRNMCKGVEWINLPHTIYKRTNVMQLGSMFICNCNIALHVSDAFCFHLQERLEIIEAASGERHETG